MRVNIKRVANLGTVVLVHGFNVKDGGASTIDKLAPYLEEAGYKVDVDDADYGFFSLWKVRFNKTDAVNRIVAALEDPNVVAVISHSNGSNYVNKAENLLSLISDKELTSIRISPALNRTTGVANCVTRCWVYHTFTDFWVWISGFLLWHPWGRQGWAGYKGRDKKIKNINLSDIIKGHSDYFKDEFIEFTATAVISHLKAAKLLKP